MRRDKPRLEDWFEDTRWSGGLSLAIVALGQATAAEALLAFEDAVRAYKTSPTEANALKIEAAALVLSRHRRTATQEGGPAGLASAPQPVPGDGVGPRRASA